MNENNKRSNQSNDHIFCFKKMKIENLIPEIKNEPIDLNNMPNLNKNDPQIFTNYDQENEIPKIKGEPIELNNISNLNNNDQQIPLNNDQENHQMPDIINESTELDNMSTELDNISNLNNNDPQISTINDQENNPVDNQSNELILIDISSGFKVHLGVHWCITHRLINLKNVIIDNSSSDLFNRLVKSELFIRNLKYLKLCNDINSKINLNELNAFQKLEHLNIHDLNNVSRKINLNLSNLKLIEIEFIPDKYCKVDYKIEIKSPKLEIVYIQDFTIIQIHNFDTIKRIFFSKFNQLINKFTNLNFIDCYSLESIKKIKLHKLKNLKGLNCYFDFEDLLKKQDKIINLFKGILDQKIDNCLFDLKFYLSDLEINDLSDLKLILKEFENRADDKMLEVYFKNLNRISGIYNSITSINYNILIDYYGTSSLSKLPNTLFIKFNNIQTIKTNNKIECSADFLNFIKQCDKLISLNLTEPELVQHFYDQLPSKISFLHFFYLKETVIKLDYNFLFKLTKEDYDGKKINMIQQFTTSQLLDLDFVSRLITELDLLNFVEFYYIKNIKITISKYNNTFHFENCNNDKTININKSRLKDICLKEYLEEKLDLIVN